MSDVDLVVLCLIVGTFLTAVNLGLWVFDHVSSSYERLALLAYWVIVMEMLRLAYAAATALLVSLELIRASRIRPFSASLERVVAVHVDERDSGVFIFTHIYLLVGCALPSWLTPYQGPRGRFSILEPLAGALIVGVGDTAASVYGKLHGRMRFGMITMSSIAANLLEAFTEQIDNLVLPMWYFAMLSIAIHV
ncbi:hypothetical protein GUITHDRAFT_104416 [Guillardia theta CCMP2712]|uniref:dolichol kinase n=1 Tax=Guillardia theta (strain CCMP2712) TaxID=905079 RepID=L1JPM5_GUITC|nr:hypothetical protein GUITHDRAFT_104416 [Guillardia theta CCMP2712]EKX50018.1 hypothetical protein GUITHDRAFT_104416 [Guillardia theta CCMP2712]|eukprot:XP_005836998.1 hypothetical protein GUITHDRAFT_104416 [Guillardia theta CCMP2712]